MSRLMSVAGAVALAALCAAPAHAVPLTFTADLSGPAEAPPNASPGTGFAVVTIDAVAHTMSVFVTFADLLGLTTASHIHAATAVPGTGTAGVATQVPRFVGFPTGVSSGVYGPMLFDMTLALELQPGVRHRQRRHAAAAEAALFGAIESGSAYLNIHSRRPPAAARSAASSSRCRSPARCCSSAAASPRSASGGGGRFAAEDTDAG